MNLNSFEQKEEFRGNGKPWDGESLREAETKDVRSVPATGMDTDTIVETVSLETAYQDVGPEEVTETSWENTKKRTTKSEEENIGAIADYSRPIAAALVEELLHGIYEADRIETTCEAVREELSENDIAEIVNQEMGFEEDMMESSTGTCGAETVCEAARMEITSEADWTVTTGEDSSIETANEIGSKEMTCEEVPPEKKDSDVATSCEDSRENDVTVSDVMEVFETGARDSPSCEVTEVNPLDAEAIGEAIMREIISNAVTTSCNKRRAAIIENSVTDLCKESNMNVASEDGKFITEDSSVNASNLWTENFVDCGRTEDSFEDSVPETGNMSNSPDIICDGVISRTASVSVIKSVGKVIADTAHPSYQSNNPLQANKEITASKGDHRTLGQLTDASSSGVLSAGPSSGATGYTATSPGDTTACGLLQQLLQQDERLLNRPSGTDVTAEKKNPQDIKVKVENKDVISPVPQLQIKDIKVKVEEKKMNVIASVPQPQIRIHNFAQERLMNFPTAAEASVVKAADATVSCPAVSPGFQSSGTGLPESTTPMGGARSASSLAYARFCWFGRETGYAYRLLSGRRRYCIHISVCVKSTDIVCLLFIETGRNREQLGPDVHPVFQKMALEFVPNYEKPYRINFSGGNITLSAELPASLSQLKSLIYAKVSFFSFIQCWGFGRIRIR
jgi:hypothetical protein